MRLLLVALSGRQARPLACPLSANNRHSASRIGEPKGRTMSAVAPLEIGNPAVRPCSPWPSPGACTNHPGGTKDGFTVANEIEPRHHHQDDSR